MQTNQQMIEVLKSGEVIAVVPKENENYYRDVHFRDHPDERKISYRAYKTPEEREQQANVLVKKIDMAKVNADAKQMAEDFKKKSVANNASETVTNVTQQ
jgi:hypothetical protein